MKKIGFVLLLGVVCFLTSCDSVVFEKKYAFKNNVMTSNDYVFEFNNPSEKNVYDVIFTMEYTPHFAFKQFVFEFNVTPEKSKTINSMFGIQLRDKSGVELGQIKGNNLVFNQLILDHRMLPKGITKISIKHAMPDDSIYCVKLIGLKIQKSK
jgi:hypothetical protein